MELQSFSVSRSASVKSDNLCSRTPIENAKIETCTKFQEENKTLRVRGFCHAEKLKKKCGSNLLTKTKTLIKILIEWVK